MNVTTALPSYEVVPFRWPLDATVRVPGSKSYTNRYLIIAALAPGRSTLEGVLFSDDTEAMIDCVRALGVAVRVDRAARVVEVDGSGGQFRCDATLNVGQSGTTARFITPLVTVGTGRYTIDGDPQMRARPMGDLIDALRQLGARVEGGSLPLVVNGGVGAVSGAVRLSGNVSSQFLSGLLLSAPAFSGGMEIELTTDLVSSSYVDLTVSAMAAAGVVVEREGRFFSVAQQSYTPGTFAIEPDASAASYLFAAAAVVGGRVRVEGLGRHSKQGDVAFVERLAAMGCEVGGYDDAIEVYRDPDVALCGIDTNMGDCSDVAPTLACVAPFATTPTRVTGIGFSRQKETDRVTNVVTELRRCGVKAIEEADGYVVHPGTPKSATVETYRDHRMAMAFAVLGIGSEGIRIADPTCVAKTFPDFWKTLEGLRILRAIAIDGVLGSGKTTVARALAERTGLAYLDTGAMYRCVGLAWLRGGGFLEDSGRFASGLRFDISDRVMLEDEDVTELIRTPEVSKAASQVATVASVREALVAQQRAWAMRRGGGVLEGRDIATVVLPGAPVKVFLTASAEERARRRHSEAPGQSLDAVTADLVWRDHNDSNREVDPLQVAVGAVVIDTTGMTVNDVVARIVSLVPWENR